MTLAIKLIQKNQGISIIVVSHDMEEIAHLSDYIFVMNESEIVLQGTPIEVFSNVRKLKELHLGVPETIRILEQLRQKESSGHHAGQYSPAALPEKC